MLRAGLAIAISILVYGPSSFAIPVLSAPNTGSLVQKANTFRGEERKELFETVSPWTAIGKLWLPVTGSCTAALVGYDLLITNAHCVVDKDSGKIVTGDYVFQVGYTEGKHYGEARVTKFWIGTSTPVTDRANDWAILRINWPMGAKVGNLGVDGGLSEQQLISLTERKTIYMFGYSADFYNGQRRFWQKNCGFEGAENGYLLHSCSGVSGASGSPMIIFNKNVGDGEDSRLVAIHAAEHLNGGSSDLVGIPYSTEYANVAVSAARFAKLVIKLKEKK